MRRPFLAVVLFSIANGTICLGQTGSLFDPENARVDASPEDSPAKAGTAPTNIVQTAYPLTESNGPILVRVASFSGDENAIYAETLAKELRERHSMNSYVFRYQAKYTPEISDEEAKKYKEQYGVAPKRYVARQEPPANWTVLAGDYPSFEDKDAQRALAAVRKFDIKSVPEKIWRQERLHTWDDANTKDAGTQFEREQFNGASDAMKGLFQQFRDLKVQKKGHLSSAMLVRNPHPKVPRSARRMPAETVKILMEMNTTTPFSVYENPNAYTLVAAQFQGGMDVGDKKGGGLFSGGKITDENRSPLAQAAKQAISLCEALKQLGWEAYVFHGQYASLVCVGGFPEKFDTTQPEYRDPRVRARLMSVQPEVNEFREKLSKVTIGGVPLAPYAELIVTPRPPAPVDAGLAN